MDGMYLRSGSKLRGLFIFAYFEGSEKVDDVKVTREVTSYYHFWQMSIAAANFHDEFFDCKFEKRFLEFNFFIAMCGWAFGRR